MGLFGLGKEREEERAVPSALELARGEYDAQRKTLPTSHIVLENTQITRALPAAQYYFACTDTEYWLLERLDASGDVTTEQFRASRVRRFARSETAVTKSRTEAAPMEQSGVLSCYAIPKLVITLANERLGEVHFTLPNNARSADFLRENLPDCAPLRLYDLFDMPEKTDSVRCKKGGGLIEDGVLLDIWREEMQIMLARSRERNPYFSKGEKLWYGGLSVEKIEYYREQGQIDCETKISGGGVTIDREGAMWGGMFGMNSNANMLENAIQSTPVRSERVEHDNRYTELAVRHEGKRALLQFDFGAAEVLRQLMPEKELEAQAVSAREPTPIEQLEILANVCERGYLTREEFEEAKRKLLAKL